jgi:hypothetical protein
MPQWKIVMYLKLLAVAACGLVLLAGEPAFGQVLQGRAAIGSWRDDKPGVRRFVADSMSNQVRVLRVPAGIVTEDGNGTIWRVSRR